MSMSDDKKTAVYLSTIDWKAVVLCLKSHAGRMAPDVVSKIGQHRLEYICEKIIEKIDIRDDQP